MQITTFSAQDQLAVKNFVLSGLKDYGFSYNKEFDFDLNDPKKYI